MEEWADDEENTNTIECKNCGTPGLHWVEFRGKWYLFDQKSSRHVCDNPFKKTAQEVFKEVK